MKTFVSILASSAILGSTAQADFTVEGKGVLQVERPGFLYLIEDDLMIASFKLFGGGAVSRVADVGSTLDNLESTRPEVLTSDISWPNEVIQVPDEIFGPQHVIVAGGFLVPGRSNGAIDLFNLETGKRQTLTKRKNGWWYHHAIWEDMNNDGRLDLLTARANKPLIGAGKGELLWLEQPENPADTWKENVMFRGPDVYFRYADLDGNGTKEIVASEFFSQRLMAYENVDGKWQSILIDDSIGQAFALTLEDLNNDGRLEVLATNHEDDAKAGVFAYEIPNDLANGEWSKHTLLTGIETVVNGINSASPGEALIVQPKTDATFKPWIVMGGDGSGKLHVLEPVSQDTNSWEYLERDILSTGNTIGKVAVGDMDRDGYSEIYVPEWEGDKVHVFSFSDLLK